MTSLKVTRIDLKNTQWRPVVTTGQMTFSPVSVDVVDQGDPVEGNFFSYFEKVEKNPTR